MLRGCLCGAHVSFVDQAVWPKVQMKKDKERPRDVEAYVEFCLLVKVGALHNVNVHKGTHF